MKVSAKTDIGRTRAENQDNYRSGMMPDGTFWALVCDGMGGGYNGKLAAVLAADCAEEYIFTALEAKPPQREFETILRQAVDRANDEVHAQALREGQVMGTTIVCAIIRGASLHLVHVGDSRAYVFDEGKLTQITKDHSLVQEMVEQGVLSAAQALHHPEKNIITRALGVEPQVECDYQRRRLKKGALLLLCSDGLTNMVGDAQIALRLAETDFYDTVSVLVNDALLAGGTDNITIVLLQAEEDDADG